MTAPEHKTAAHDPSVPGARGHQLRGYRGPYPLPARGHAVATMRLEYFVNEILDPMLEQHELRMTTGYPLIDSSAHAPWHPGPYSAQFRPERGAEQRFEGQRASNWALWSNASTAVMLQTSMHAVPNYIPFFLNIGTPDNPSRTRLKPQGDAYEDEWYFVSPGVPLRQFWRQYLTAFNSRDLSRRIPPLLAEVLSAQPSSG